MKPIKISDSNIEAIRDKLAKVNGNATAHTYSTVNDIISIKNDAERRLDKLLSKKSQVGAELVYESGYGVPNAYKYSRRVTRVTLQRRSTGWFIKNIESGNCWPGSHDEFRAMFLTPDQWDAAIARLKADNRIALKVG